MSSVRAAAVAGMFYPGDARALAAELEDLLGEVEDCEPRLAIPKALVVPHAGYIYSGPVAAHAYDRLAGARGVVRRVVLLGPCHRVAVRGLAVPTAGAFATPLGEVAQVLERLWGGPETLVVVSTDLSHYHSYEEARRIDSSTLARIAARAADIDHEEACGATPLNGLLLLARRHGHSLGQLAACNSGDTAGGKQRVVGYSSFALYEGEGLPLARAGEALLAIARGAIEQELLGAGAPSFDAPWLRQAAATFVTLKKRGELRGCIGSLQATRALSDDVAHNALAAAFRDPRFPPLARDEWPACAAEVSLLSAPRPLRFADEEDLVAQLRPGEDGLIIEAQGRRGTFLPQVWESLPEPRDFLRGLVRKAALPDDTRLARCRFYRYRVAKFDGR